MTASFGGFDGMRAPPAFRPAGRQSCVRAGSGAAVVGRTTEGS